MVILECYFSVIDFQKIFHALFAQIVLAWLLRCD